MIMIVSEIHWHRDINKQNDQTSLVLPISCFISIFGNRGVKLASVGSWPNQSEKRKGEDQEKTERKKDRKKA